MHDEIKNAFETLRQEGLILFPTKSAWLIGCDATSENATKRLLGLHANVSVNDSVLYVDSVGRLNSYLNELPDIAWDLLEMSEKPLTLFLPDSRNLAASLMSSDSLLGFQVAQDDFTRNLCMRLRKPLLALPVSCIQKNAVSCFDDVSEKTLELVNYIVKLYQKEKLKPDNTSIIELGKGNVVKIIRN